MSVIGDVLVGLDGSPEAAAALRWAGRFASAIGSHLVLVHGWERGGALLGEEARHPTVDAMEADVCASLRELAGRELDDGALVADCRAVRGEIPSRLAKEARRIGADLVVVGSHGAGGARRRLLGSVSGRLVERPAHPVVIVPPSAPPVPFPGGPIVVGADGTPASSRAMRWAAQVAAAAGSRVVAVHAFESPVTDPSAAEARSLLDEVHERLQVEWCSWLAAAGVPFDPVVIDRDARDAIRATADDVQPACVVVGSRGLGLIAQQLLGSVTSHLVREMEWPTVVIPAPQDCPVWPPAAPDGGGAATR